MPLSFLLHEQEDVVDDYAKDLPRDEQPVLVVEVERTSVPHPTAPAPPETVSPSSMSHQPSEHIPCHF